MPAPALRTLRPASGVLLVLLLVLPAPSGGVMSEPVDPLPPSAVAPPPPAPLPPGVEESFARVKARVRDSLLAERDLHLGRAEREGVHISEEAFTRALHALGRFEVLSEEAWAEKMRGVWGKCVESDACTAPVVAEGRLVRTLTYVRASAVPGADTLRRVTQAQLAELLEHEVAHVLLMLVGFRGNQDVFITERWTLGTPDSALAAHKRVCTDGVC